ncbi:hypothetical protein GCM10010970_16420 [Silvimonas iriomotensis]|uniref:Uncharacterized protein n=2 Tax=Silvimonas iriomotensis TaxID=449662 RepID=A0ABQ2P824_9NEIS|nr:hypothetical protein GCM10010970_16420 [Silvimonas iriomotensis]
MEAMSAGMACVHPNLGALYETAANWTNMYQYHQDHDIHAEIFYHALSMTILSWHTPATQQRLALQKDYADMFYSWDRRETQWRALLEASKDSLHNQGSQ